mmetsp:Transcript_124628/g.360536  ORF Transcript_124628/g.360536 Transcript_124628/m.360536 type:complete len:334 (+) Transcript_124628:1154-2155(+)
MTPQISKLARRVVGAMTAVNQDDKALCAAAIREPLRKARTPSPGYFLPQPNVWAKSFALPKGNCATAGNDTASSSSDMMKPFPESFRPSSALESSARNAKKRMYKAKDAVPSPPPETSLALHLFAHASRIASNNSTRKTSSAPPRPVPLTTSIMLKARRFQYGVLAANAKMSRPALAPESGFINTSVGTCSSQLNAGSRESFPYRFAGRRYPTKEEPFCRSSLVASIMARSSARLRVTSAQCCLSNHLSCSRLSISTSSADMSSVRLLLAVEPEIASSVFAAAAASWPPRFAVGSLALSCSFCALKASGLGRRGAAPSNVGKARGCSTTSPST